MSPKIVKEYDEDGVVIREGINQPYALVSLNTMRAIVTSLQDAEACVSKISNKDASISLEIIRDKLNPILIGLEDVAKDLGVEIQITNTDFEYERAKKELEEAMAILQAMGGPDEPDAA
ncbi:MAG: hypothetical protein KZQ91_12285 [Candidatus Thiodiazotropha sp. (ex Lucinoma borealis)]|nr:hypothetical protein [Candidatus Thiodiazotropha sp. (ex Lucinoma borealis)]